jgi:SAM-dependent methyltransferase
MRDAYYRSKLAHRARGLAHLDRFIGGVDAEIEALLQRRKPVRILELGCGFGTALLELRERYGDRVALHGLNREPHDGDTAILVRNAAEHGWWTAHSDPATLPRLHYADVAKGLPFDDASFDLVYSQVAWLYFGDKINVLRDLSRVLAPDGIAKLDVDERRPNLPDEYARLVEIWEDGILVPFGDYVERHGMALEPAQEGQFLHFGHAPSFGSDLELVQEIDLARIHPHWDGIKCVYRVRR